MAGSQEWLAAGNAWLPGMTVSREWLEAGNGWQDSRAEDGWQRAGSRELIGALVSPTDTKGVATRYNLHDATYKNKNKKDHNI